MTATSPRTTLNFRADCSDGAITNSTPILVLGDGAGFPTVGRNTSSLAWFAAATLAFGLALRVGARRRTE